MIEKNKAISFGQPTIKGRRLTVYDVISGIYNDGLEIYLKDQELSLEQAKEAITYCMNLKCQDQPGRFCSSCILSTLQNGSPKNRNDYEVKKFGSEFFLVNKETGSIFLGNKQEYENQLLGDIGWALARQVSTYITL